MYPFLYVSIYMCLSLCLYVGREGEILNMRGSETEKEGGEKDEETDNSVM